MKRYLVSVWAPGTSLGEEEKIEVNASSVGVALRRACQDETFDRKIGPDGLLLKIREVSR